MPEETKNTEETQDTIEIEEVSTPEPTAFSTRGMLPEEIELAKSHGLVEEEVKEEEDGEHDRS